MALHDAGDAVDDLDRVIDARVSDGGVDLGGEGFELLAVVGKLHLDVPAAEQRRNAREDSPVAATDLQGAFRKVLSRDGGADGRGVGGPKLAVGARLFDGKLLREGGVLRLGGGVVDLLARLLVGEDRDGRGVEAALVRVADERGDLGFGLAGYVNAAHLDAGIGLAVVQAEIEQRTAADDDDGDEDDERGAAA